MACYATACLHRLGLLPLITLTTLTRTCLHQAVPLNRFALDYWKHGQKAALVTANGLREGDAWQVGGRRASPPVLCCAVLT